MSGGTSPSDALMTSMSHVTGEPTLPRPAASPGGRYRSITAGPSGQKGSEVHVHDGGPHLTSSGDPGSCWAQTAEGRADGPSPRHARRVCSGENCGAGSERLGGNRAWACPGPCPLHHGGKHIWSAKPRGQVLHQSLLGTTPLRAHRKLASSKASSHAARYKQDSGPPRCHLDANASGTV